MAVSTSTASRLPEISVEEIGDHFIPLVPGAKSLVTTGIWALTKTSHCNRLVMASPIKVPRGPCTVAPSTGLTNLLNEVESQEMRAACDLYPGSLLPEPNARGAKHSCHLLRADEERGFFSGTLRSLRISQFRTGGGDNVCYVVRLDVECPPQSGDS